MTDSTQTTTAPLRPDRFRDPEQLAKFVIENEWALEDDSTESGMADWRETLNRVHDAWDDKTPNDILDTIAEAIRLDRSYRTPVPPQENPMPAPSAPHPESDLSGIIGA